MVKYYQTKKAKRTKKAMKTKKTRKAKKAIQHKQHNISIASYGSSSNNIMQRVASRQDTFLSFLFYCSNRNIILISGRSTERVCSFISWIDVI